MVFGYDGSVGVDRLFPNAEQNRDSNYDSILSGKGQDLRLLYYIQSQLPYQWTDQPPQLSNLNLHLAPGLAIGLLGIVRERDRFTRRRARPSCVWEVPDLNSKRCETVALWQPMLQAQRFILGESGFDQN